MALPHKVALVITSYHGPFYPDGYKTGAFYSEVLHPFEVFHKAGYDVDIISENGKFGWDEHSTAPAFASEEELAKSKNPEDPFHKALANIKSASEVNVADYGILFSAGGHGTIFDFVGKTPGLYKLGSGVWANGGVVSAVCHGPVLLPGIKDEKTGESILKGRRATGFPDSGEVAMQLTDLLNKDHLAFTATEIKNAGADYVNVDPPFDVKVVTDGKLVTGANPGSATPTAEAALKAFQA